MKFACPKCRTSHALADSELPVGRTFRFVCSNCGHTLGVRRKDDSAASNEAAPLAKAGPAPAQPEVAAATPHGASVAQQPAQPNQTQQHAHAAPTASQASPAHGAPPVSHAHAAPPASAHHPSPPAAAPHLAPPASAAQPPRPASPPAQQAAGMPPAATELQSPPPAAARPPAPAPQPTNLAAPMQGAPQPAPAGAHGAPQPANKVQVVANHAAAPAASATPSNKPPAPVQLNPFAKPDAGAASGNKRPSKAQAAASGEQAADDAFDDSDSDMDFDAAGSMGHTEADSEGLGDDDLADLEHMPSEPNFLSAEEQAYVEAAPGQATQLFMQTAGIYKRRKRLRVAAWSIGGSLIAVCALITADMTGLVSLPVMGAVYDAAGVQDPDAHRGIERAKSQLSSSTLTSAQREELRHKLMGYDADVPTPAPAPAPRHRANERKALEPPVPAAQVFSKIDKMEEAPRGEAAGTQSPAQAAAEAAPLAGELSPGAIGRVVKANSHGLTTCINEAMRKGGNISGTLEVQVVIAPSGEVKDAQVQTERFRNTPLGHCATKRVKGWRFPRFNAEPMTVVFPYVLSGGG